ncbi:hypothetical protein DFH06DRAFT_1185067 [Mycena polygramma]|nr:hypothetical protein DFH06DRAFT_1185067 [Mycena polygramma]
MSVEELRARIAKLTAEIDVQRELLKKMEEERSLLQRQLNVGRDPIARLPLEISSSIFVWCLPVDTHISPSAGRASMLLLNICNAWTKIALSTPALWVAIQIFFDATSAPSECLTELLPIWFQRARKHPLSISLCETYDPDPAVAAIVWQQAPQLKHLEIWADEDEDQDDPDIAAETRDLFGGMSPGPLPMLETFMVCALRHGRGFPAVQIFELLRLAPNLTECKFDCMDPVHLWEDDDAEELELPKLRRLTFGQYPEPPNSDEEIIMKNLSLPGLEALSLSLRDFTMTDFVAFLERSSPPLKELIIGHGTSPRTFAPLADCLRLTPALTHLELWEVWQPNSPFVPDLFAALVASQGRGLLPDLQRLAIHLFVSDIPDSSWTLLLRALSARPQLRAVRISLDVVSLDDAPPAWGSVKPGEEVLAAFRDMVANGKDVHIGTENCNFISA